MAQHMSKIIKGFILAIAAIGVIRFALDAGGVPKDVVKYFSMSVVMTAGAVYFAIAASTHKERLRAAYLLVMPYMAVEVVALSYTWASGRQTIFHADEYSLGTSIGVHTLGHLIGGFTWEPLLMFVLMEIVWGAYTFSRSLLKTRTV
jgi:hypothetical protein